jgi:hypothetical protein
MRQDGGRDDRNESRALPAPRAVRRLRLVNRLGASEMKSPAEAEMTRAPTALFQDLRAAKVDFRYALYSGAEHDFSIPQHKADERAANFISGNGDSQTKTASGA